MAKAAETTRSIGQKMIKGIGNLAGLALALWKLDAERIVQKGGDALQSVVGVELQGKGLEKLRSELIELLKTEERRIVVVIDDLDRLMPQEVREMIALVKSLGDLPYVVYLLVFDEGVVRDSLSGPERSQGPGYLEKLVQAPFDLPPPTQSGLDRLLFSELDDTFGESVDLDRIRGAVRNAVGIWCGAISGNMKVSFQAARSIG
jgi:predicted KAP-like P-loop ATPase